MTFPRKGDPGRRHGARFRNGLCFPYLLKRCDSSWGVAGFLGRHRILWRRGEQKTCFVRSTPAMVFDDPRQAAELSRCCGSRAPLLTVYTGVVANSRSGHHAGRGFVFRARLLGDPSVASATPAARGAARRADGGPVLLSARSPSGGSRGESLEGKSSADASPRSVLQHPAPPRDVETGTSAGLGQEGISSGSHCAQTREKRRSVAYGHPSSPPN